MPRRPRPPRVVFWQNQASPHMVARYQLVAARGNLDLDAIWTGVYGDNRTWTLTPSEWKFPHRTLSGGTARHVAQVLEHLRLVQPDVLIAEYDRPDFAAALLLAPTVVPRTAARVLPNFDDWSTRTRHGEAAKALVFRSLSAAVVPGPESVELAGRYGLPPERCFPLTQTVDVANYSRGRELTPTEREQKRQELGLHGTVFIHSGRLWSGKGLDCLFDAYREAARENTMSLLMLGAGPDEQHYKDLAKDLPNVVFGGFLQNDVMPIRYALADAMVFPTLGDPHGLVVEEAMCAGIPVISSSAAGHIRLRVRDGENGFVFPANDSAALAELLKRAARDPAETKAMGERATAGMTEFDHSRWAQEFEAFVHGAMELPPRGRLRG